MFFSCSFHTNKNHNNRFVYSFRKIVSCVYYYKQLVTFSSSQKSVIFFIKEQGCGSINYEIKHKIRFLLLKIEIRVTVDSNSRHVYLDITIFSRRISVRTLFVTHTL